MKNKLLVVALITGMCVTACAKTEDVSETVPSTTAAESVGQTENETTTAEATETETETVVQPETTEETTVGEDYIVWETEENVEADYSQVNGRYEEESEKRADNFAKIAEKKDNPVLYITTDDGKIIKDKKYHPVVVDLFNCDEEYMLSSVNAEVKVRGNSSASSKPYPYRIKFEEKHNMLGLHDGNEFKNWVLLKPYWTFCPNYLALNLAKNIFDGEYYVSDCKFVNLYMNGSYQGLYLLCEQNQVGKNRVDVNDAEYGDTSTNIGYFVEMDNNPGEDHPFFELDYGKRKLTDINGKEREIPADNISIISDICCDAQKNFIQKYMAGVYDIMWYAIEENTAKAFDEDYNLIDVEGVTPEEAVRNVIDVRSFMNMLLLEELVQNYDVGAGSFYFCVDFSEKSKFEKLTLTCPWDFNWAYEQNPNRNYYASTWQNSSDNYDRSNMWFILLMKADWFRSEFYDFVDKCEESGVISDTLKSVSSSIQKYRGDLEGEEWKVDKGDEICDFVRKRMKFLIKESTKYKEESNE